ncbi:MAG TPA: peptide deformylase [Actinomycetota bacterium]|jgi:peptide deformylase|nr:peptide deformylase [Actinomycetota bacterium]
MSTLPIRVFGDPVLREPANPVEFFDGGLRRLAEDMIQTMREAPGVGLAAPQVGRSLRLIVFDIGDEGGARALANPVLKNEWGEQLADEGCLSVPGLYYPVRRAKKVWAEGVDLDGHEVTIEGEDLLARVLQHEVDHLNGILFIDRLDGEHRSEAMAKLRDQALGLAPTVHDPSRTF